MPKLLAALLAVPAALVLPGCALDASLDEAPAEVQVQEGLTAARPEITLRRPTLPVGVETIRGVRRGDVGAPSDVDSNPRTTPTPDVVPARIPRRAGVPITSERDPAAPDQPSKNDGT